MAEATVPGADDNKRWWSKALLVGGVIAAVCLLVGSLGTRFGIWPFGTGFLLLMAGSGLAVLGTLLGTIGLIVCYAKGLVADRSSTLIGLLISVLILALMGSQFMQARSVPPIHNISTDTANPPRFDKVAALRGADSNPLEYDAEKLAGLQNEAYPWVKPLRSSATASEMFGRALNALNDMGLEVVSADDTKGIIEATDTSFWFGFKDDVVVRIRSAGQGSNVDIRSVSRVGQSDLGVNARRIGEILDRLKDG